MINLRRFSAALAGLTLLASVTSQALAADAAAGRAEPPPVPTTTAKFLSPGDRPTEYKCGVYKGGKGQDVTWCGCTGILDCKALSKLCSGPLMEDGNDPSKGGCIAPSGTPSAN